MRALSYLLPCLLLVACDRESSRKLGQKIGELSYESSRNTEEFIKGSMETTKQKREAEFGPAPTTEERIRQWRQEAENERRAKDKGFPGHTKESPFSRESYQGFPGFQK